MLSNREKGYSIYMQKVRKKKRIKTRVYRTATHKAPWKFLSGMCAHANECRNQSLKGAQTRRVNIGAVSFSLSRCSTCLIRASARLKSSRLHVSSVCLSFEGDVRHFWKDDADSSMQRWNLKSEKPVNSKVFRVILANCSMVIYFWNKMKITSNEMSLKFSSLNFMSYRCRKCKLGMNSGEGKLVVSQDGETDVFFWIIISQEQRLKVDREAVPYSGRTGK